MDLVPTDKLPTRGTPSPKKTFEIPKFLEVEQVATFEQGDRVLMVMSSTMSGEQVVRYTKYLQEKFPGVEFAFLSGVQQILIQKGHKANNTSPVESLADSQGIHEGE